MTIIEEIAAERARQIEQEGFTAGHDLVHDRGELAAAAACYAQHASWGRHDPLREAPYDWPWHPQWWKPKNPRRDLVRAAALIVAEIERLDRSGA